MIRANHARVCCGVVILLLGLAPAGAAQVQTTAFTYQGRLTDGGAPVNGSYDLQFTLWDSLHGGTQQPQPAPPTLTKTAVDVRGGVFSVLLDFGVSAFPGADRFLEVGLRPGGTGGAFNILGPRQQVSPTPYAIRTLNATAADSLSAACVGCVTDSQINSVAASKLTGTLPASSVPSGSGNYIQNRSALTSQSASFNISGNGIIGGDLTVSGKINADVSGNFIQNRGIGQPRQNASFNISGKGYIGDDGFIGGNTFVNGNALQARNKGGWVKAMALVTGDAAIAICYNSQMADGGASTPGCGFKVRAPSLTFIDFGFQVNDRFISVTSAAFSGGVGGNVPVSADACCTPNEVRVKGPKPFYIFVF
jgi:hypothetical protein